MHSNFSWILRRCCLLLRQWTIVLQDRQVELTFMRTRENVRLEYIVFDKHYLLHDTCSIWILTNNIIKICCCLDRTIYIAFGIKGKTIWGPLIFYWPTFHATEIILPVKFTAPPKHVYLHLDFYLLGIKNFSKYFFITLWSRKV